MVYDFGEFSFDERRLMLSRAGERLRLPRKVLEVLAVLLRRSGDVVTREELMAEVWQGAHVEAGVLTQAIFLLRKAFGDNPAEPRFIATIQGRGYVFLGAVARVEGPSPELSASALGGLRGRRSRWAMAAGLAAAALLVTHRPPASQQTSLAPTIGPAAYEKYLEARHLLSQRNERGLGLALAYFQQAIEHAPDYAPAHAGLAEAEALMGVYDYGAATPGARYDRARLAARRAVELDPRSGEGWAILGMVSLLGDLDAVEAQRHLDRAVSLAPNSPRAHHWRAWVLFVRGRPYAAEQELRRARALDPLSAIIRTAQATLSLYRGRLSEGQSRYQEVLELEPAFARARLGLGLIAEQQGHLALAERHLQAAASQLGDPEEAWAALAHLYGKANRREDWEAVFSRLGRDKASPYARALALLGIGDERRALQALRDAIDQRRVGPWDLTGDPRLREIRGPAFDRLLAEAGLDPSANDASGAGYSNPRGPRGTMSAFTPRRD
jgi:DNA-binding winged helix-turn-helix (wHTH) protein/Tfp pilus assembly protein PilF